MNKKSREGIRGFEYDWLASDADGHVALFSTAGGGYAPEEFLDDIDVHDLAIATILWLPVSTRARSAPQLSTHLPNTWRGVAERELFAYDSDFHGGPYRLVAAPEIPVHVGDLPASVAGAVRSVSFRNLCFADQSALDEVLLKRR
jgi:hypothetical protein